MIVPLGAHRQSTGKKIHVNVELMHFRVAVKGTERMLRENDVQMSLG